MTAEVYNAAVELIEPNLAARPAKIAFIDPAGAYSYAETAQRVDRCANAIRGLGLKPGDRIVLAMLDGIDFVSAFLGAIKAGFVPIPVNTLLTPSDYGYMLTDSGAKAAVVSLPLLPVFETAIAESDWSGELVPAGAPDKGLSLLMAEAAPTAEAYPTKADETAFWLYSSGSTGRPKGTLHRHGSPKRTAEMFARGVFGLAESDVVFSVAKLFFAYGLGNALTFPMSVGATAVLLPDRATPDAVAALIKKHGVTVFCGVPTLYAAMLASPALPAAGEHKVRVCLSAGEALPEELGRAWNARVGCEIVDGIGSTEMLHIYVSNRPGQVAYGVTGTPVPGYLEGVL
jgi:benzoate-CoA ligase